jgi:hypothetical protein
LFHVLFLFNQISNTSDTRVTQLNKEEYTRIGDMLSELQTFIDRC